MIKVSFSKPKLIFIPASNDMSHFSPSHYTTSDYFLMELIEFMEKKEFGSFNMKPRLTEEQMGEMLARAKNPEPLSQEQETVLWLTNPWEVEFRRLIKQSGSIMWQFNAVNKDMSGYVRQIVILGETKFYAWSWFDCYVKRPIFSVTVRLLNKLRFRKVKKEIQEWDNFLNNMRKEK